MTAPSPGWYPDPDDAAAWRWWDGTGWTAHSAPIAAPATRTRRRLPRWLSVPVVVAAPIALVGLVLAVRHDPEVLVMSLVPLGIVLPALAWLDRVEPEPWPSRLHAMLWGASVAAVVGFVVNTLVYLASSEVIAAGVSAPIVEESAKAVGVLWALRRREIDGISDGVVYAGWIAVGFAAVEDAFYFADAATVGALGGVFVLRALVTPFAHPLFTFWTGLAVGRAVHRGRRVFPSALWGLGLAILSHAAWNGTILAAEQAGDEVTAGVIVLAGMAVFFVLFVTVVVTLIVMRGRERRRLERMLPFLALQYGLDDTERAMFVDWRELRRARRRLPRRARGRFDRVHANLARLALLHSRLGALDKAAEADVANQLATARAELAAARSAHGAG